MGAYVCGIDIGISGVKVIVLRKDGFVSARSYVSLPKPVVENGKSVQNPLIWWDGVRSALKVAMASLEDVGGNTKEVSAICIDATSGTIVPIDDKFNPVCDGILYNDERSQEEAGYLNEIGIDCIKNLGYRFDTRFALPKIIYIKRNMTDVWENTKYFFHQADYIVSKFLGDGAKAITDTSNALKTGYDILNFRWPQYMKDIGIDHKMPDVEKTGSVLGVVDKEVGNEFGFSKDLKIIAGMTDSVAANVASGAKKEGDMNTILGSLTTWKVLSKDVVKDEHAMVYSHLHPSGHFLPGGVGSSGGSGIKSMMNVSPRELAEYAFGLKIDKPSNFFAYPIPTSGEKFPFIDSGFKPFISKKEEEGVALYKALIEGAACIERWGYEKLRELEADISGQIWTSGGGAMVDSWMKIRANVLNRVVLRTKFPESVYGAALIAAMATWFNGDFTKTSDAFVIEMARFEPDDKIVNDYDEYYYDFKEYVNKIRNST